jgi:hypothetical protein
MGAIFSGTGLVTGAEQNRRQTPMKTNNTPAESGKVTLLDRDLSILAFNERVLEWAHRADVPALERLRYLCIVSSNLDEFFEIRAAPHLPASRTTPGEGTEPTGGFFRIADAAHRLVDRQYTIFNDEVLPALGQHGIRIVPHGERNQAQRQWVRAVFQPRGAPVAGAGQSGSVAPVSAGGQQITELCGASQRCGRLRQGQRDRDRQGAARPAAHDPLPAKVERIAINCGYRCPA